MIDRLTVLEIKSRPLDSPLEDPSAEIISQFALSAGAQRLVIHSAERLCSSGDDLIVWHIAEVLSDVPAMPEWVLELAVPVAPEHVCQRLTDLCARGYRLREHCLGVSDVEGQHDGCATNRGRGEHPHLGELIGDMQQAAGNP